MKGLKRLRGMKGIKGKSKSSGSLFIIIAIICGLLAAFLSYSSINSITKKTPILIANKKIVAGDPIKEENFTIVSLPKGGVPKDAIYPKEPLNSLVALIEMSDGDILRRNNVVDMEKEDLPILSTRLRAVNESLEDFNTDPENNNLRAGEIPVDSIIGMISGMKEGDKIAVTSVYEEEIKDGGQNKKIRRTETIFDYIHVLGIKSIDDNSKGNVVIALTQKQFEALALAREKGKFYIALMSYGIKKPDNHPEILSDLYIEMLENPEKNLVIDDDVTDFLTDY